MGIDPEFAHALHVVVENRRRAAADPATPHHVIQTSIVSALLDGAYDGEMTIGEMLAHGDIGLGTLDRLDGELIILDGEALVGRVDGSLSPVPHDTRTPFAVVTRFRPSAPIDLSRLAHDELLAALEAIASSPVSAVRIRGRFSRLRLRSVPRQEQPYRPLAEVVLQQAEWEAGPADATLVGFGFPTAAAGVQVPGWHLHAVTADRTTGGHVLIGDLESGRVWMDAAQEFHVELPPGIEIRAADEAARRAIVNAETRFHDG